MTPILNMVFVSLGLFLLVVSAIGLIRLPDFYSRVHAVSKSETLGLTLVLLGLILEEGLSLVSLKLVLAVAFLFLTNPLAAHVLTRAAVRTGLLPWRRPEIEAKVALVEVDGATRKES
ncbi:MAG: monovalent cation/H(+) antiporter subunit G [Dehalococcoidia bacterium]